jgi:hypothetical protein
MSRIDDETLLHFGGYLVCLLADLRHRTSYRAETRLRQLVDELEGELGALARARSRDTRMALIDAADQTLTKMVAFNDQLSPNFAREYLGPIYESRAKLFKDCDPRVDTFLRLLCEATPLSQAVSSFTHTSRHYLSDVGGVLVAALEATQQDQRKLFGRSTVLNADTMMSISARFDILLKRLHRFVHGAWWDAGEELIASYYRTRFHACAVELALVKAREHAAPFRVEFAESFTSPSNGPHVTPLLECLHYALTDTQYDEVLLADAVAEQFRTNASFLLAKSAVS